MLTIDGVTKTYLAQVRGTIPRDLGRRLREGVELEDGIVRVDGEMRSALTGLQELKQRANAVNRCKRSTCW